MSWRDRPYSGSDSYNESFGGGGMTSSVFGGMAKPPKAVKWLLVINFAVFVVQLLSGVGAGRAGFMTRYFAAYGPLWWQLWRYITFQFLHGGIMHIALNMLGLYFMGTPLEQRFGTKWFLSFYLTCGAAAGVLYSVMAIVWGSPAPLVGASGGVYAIILAAAVYFPHFKLIMMFFPVPIRLASVIIFSIMILTIISGIGGDRSGNVWSQVAHFGGAAAGAIWLLMQHKRPLARASETIQNGRWEKKVSEMRQIQQQADAVLDKVRQHGIQSLTSKDKKILKKATDLQKEQEDRIKNL